MNEQIPNKTQTASYKTSRSREKWGPEFPALPREQMKLHLLVEAGHVCGITSLVAEAGLIACLPVISQNQRVFLKPRDRGEITCKLYNSWPSLPEQSAKPRRRKKTRRRRIFVFYLLCNLISFFCPHIRQALGTEKKLEKEAPKQSFSPEHKENLPLHGRFYWTPTRRIIQSFYIFYSIWI